MNCEQWIADVYHCGESWGVPMTEEEMRIMLEECRIQAAPEDYVPDVSMAKECTEYWNALCVAYPR